MPEPIKRYRCSLCGNLTRFDITITRRTKAYYHYTLGGELTVEDEEVIAETIETVSCNWCVSPNHIEVLTQQPDPSNEPNQGSLL